jgi:hypothetical protein
MVKQIRIYYECLEQGADYIKPIIESVIDQNTEIVLVRRPKKASDLNDGSVAALFTMTTPDALITGIYNNIEYPLVLIEFTEAVTTEDHELQRTYGAIAAYLSGAYYLKLAGEKKSEKEFGGAFYNPYSTPKIFINKFGYEGYIIAKWETENENDYTLQRNTECPSCPPCIDLFSDTIQHAVSTFISNPTQWFDCSLKKLKEQQSYKNFRLNVDSASGENELLNTWKMRKDSNLNKLRFLVKPDKIAVKINRFSHAMDPDRGIITFISFMFSNDKNIYGIYALVRPRGNDLMKQDMTSVSLMQLKLDNALEMDKGGLPDWLMSELKKAAKNAKSLKEEIDFQPVWEKHISELTENKVVMTLAYFLDGMYLNHNGILLTWNKRKLINACNRDFIPALSQHFKFTQYVEPTAIVEIVRDVNEDEVTYAIIHRVLIPNGFKIVSVSYPGAQGGGAILPNPDLGKAQPREYPDVIAMPPEGSEIDIVLNESKGMFSLVGVNKDLNKILLYKTDEMHKKALKETLFVARVIDKNKQLQNIIIGISFGIKSNTISTWLPDKVDFIFRIVDRKKWAIGIFKQEMKDLIPQIEGNTDFPKLYECNKDVIKM